MVWKLRCGIRLAERRFSSYLMIKGADRMVQAASKPARFFGVPAMVIGLTVIPPLTGMPETSIGIMSAVSKINALTLVDIIGSSVANTANISLI